MSMSKNYYKIELKEKMIKVHIMTALFLQKILAARIRMLYSYRI